MKSADRVLLRAMRAHPWPVGGMAICAVTDAVLTLAIPASLAAVIDAALRGSLSEDRVVLFGVLIALVTVVELGYGVLQGRAAGSTTATLRAVLLRHVLALGPRHGRPTGDLVSRVLSGAGEAAAVARTAIGLVTSVITSVGGLVALALIDLRLLGVFALGVPLAWLVARFFVAGAATVTGRYQDVQGRLSARFVDAMTGVRTIGAGGTVETEVSRVLAPLPEMRRAGYEMWQLQRTAGWRLAVLNPLLQVAVLSIAGYGVTQGTVSPGQLLAASGYLALALGLLGQVALVAEIGRARGAAARVAEVLDDVPPPTGTARLPEGPGHLVLRGVTVRVADRMVLDALDLDIPAGTTVAIVGRSGTGKSTLAAVAGGLFTPDGGDVLLDGQRLADTHPAAVRAAVSYAFARPTLLGTTVADSLAYTDLPIDRATVERAAHTCHAGEFVTRLPDGFDTPLAGLRLSGGELQRLGLARAACRDCRLVILDDALSSLDVATEARVTAALGAALTGRTRLIVTHRVATAARADLVAWLDGGRIRALDTHDRLWRVASYRAAFGAMGDRSETVAVEVGA